MYCTNKTHKQLNQMTDFFINHWLSNYWCPQWKEAKWLDGIPTVTNDEAATKHTFQNVEWHMLSPCGVSDTLQ